MRYTGSSRIEFTATADLHSGRLGVQATSAYGRNQHRTQSQSGIEMDNKAEPQHNLPDNAHNVGVYFNQQ